jgi:hypothetical protein
MAAKAEHEQEEETTNSQNRRQDTIQAGTPSDRAGGRVRGGDRIT